MSEQLYLQEARNVLAEPGLTVGLDFGPGRDEEVRALRRSGYLQLTNAWYDTIGGCIVGQPRWSLASMVEAAWTRTTQSNWQLAASSLTPDATPVDWLTHKADADWTLEEATAAALGQGRFVGLICYDTQASEGGVGTDSPIIIDFGGVWRVHLLDSGTGYLYEVATDPDTLAQTATLRAEFEWMTADRFAGDPVTPHWLWIYELGSTLVIRNLSMSLQGRFAGLRYTDPGAATDPDGRVDRTGALLRHALRAGKWKLSGGGYVGVNVSPQAFVPGTSGIAAPLTRILPFSSRRCNAYWHGAALKPGYDWADAAFVVTDQDGAVWAQGTGTVSPVKTQFAWSLAWETTADTTVGVAATEVVIPPYYRADGNSGTDVIAVAGVADKQVQVVREGDLTRERLSARLLAMNLNLASYCQSNMLVRYVVGGVTRFRGLTNRATWTVERDSTQPTGYLDLEAEGLWRRFRKALWPGGQAFDGRLLTDCLADLLAAAGLASTDYELAACSFVFPKPPDGEAPALVFRAGTSVDRILEELAAKWYGRTLRHYFRLSDGKFVLAYTTAGSSVASFYETSAAAVTAGVPYQTIRAGSYQETLDDSEMFNAITVAGQNSNGDPLLAKAVDWASINDSTAWNYVGEPWQLVVIDPALCTQAAVNFVCRSLFDRHRYPRIFAQWNSLRVDLFPGDVVTLVGPSYGDTYIIRSVTLTKSTDGAGAAPAGIASYAAELIRSAPVEGGEEEGGGDPEPDPGGGGGEEPPGGGGVTPG